MWFLMHARFIGGAERAWFAINKLYRLAIFRFFWDSYIASTIRAFSFSGGQIIWGRARSALFRMGAAVLWFSCRIARCGIFRGLFASIGKIFVFGGKAGTRLWF